uniref:Uncharacterized protein n=1 Tax=Candidatus Kentrum sp. FM TaxID=2126340 RepID=A0A450TU86_9GAMM|nr:MAG: hypothetical protein BECKFM1743A_GA0114220_106431 [Candidatus Kentron sp. FM]
MDGRMFGGEHLDSPYAPPNVGANLVFAHICPIRPYAQKLRFHRAILLSGHFLFFCTFFTTHCFIEAPAGSGAPSGHRHISTLGIIRLRLHRTILFISRSALRMDRILRALVTTYLPYDGLAQPSRNGCSGPLAIAIDIATRYRTSRIRSIAIANQCLMEVAA